MKDVEVALTKMQQDDIVVPDTFKRKYALSQIADSSNIIEISASSTCQMEFMKYMKKFFTTLEAYSE